MSSRPSSQSGRPPPQSDRAPAGIFSSKLLVGVALAVIIAALARTFAGTAPSPLNLRATVRSIRTVSWPRFFNTDRSKISNNIMTDATSDAAPAPGGYVAPVWFISHGGPPTMFQPSHPAFKEWEKFGAEIKREHNDGKGGLKGLLAVSAHWQSDTPGTVQVNVDERNPLVYDFYGFPDHFYSVKVTSQNPSAFSSMVLSELNAAFANSASPSLSLRKAAPTRRGPDHGVWVPLKVAFAPESSASRTGKWAELESAAAESALPPTLPMVQVTLPPSDDAEASLALGAALRSLRSKGVGIFAGGQGVHNLRDFGKYMEWAPGADSPSVRKGAVAPYSASFSQALVEAIGAEPSATASEASTDPRWQAAANLMKRSDYKGAHPTPEHLLPAFVALGAAAPHEKLASTFSLPEGSLSWNMFSTLSRS